MKECITHHHACDCREEYIKKLEAVVRAAARVDAAIAEFGYDHPIEAVQEMHDRLAEIAALEKGEGEKS